MYNSIIMIIIVLPLECLTLHIVIPHVLNDLFLGFTAIPVSIVGKDYIYVFILPQ